MAKHNRYVLAAGLLLFVGAIGLSDQAAAQELSAADKQALEAEVTAKLNGSSWTIGLIPMFGEKPTDPIQDTLTFKEGKVSSQRLVSAGYAESNYTLTIGDDGTPVWETMQTSQEEGVAFWRGELRGENMRGILSKHPLEGNAEDYSFSSSGSQTSPSDQSRSAHAPTAEAETVTADTAAVELETLEPTADTAAAEVEPKPADDTETPRNRKTEKPRRGFFGR